MASLTKRNGIYLLRWYNGERYPKQISESLKTKNFTQAKRKKVQLENAYYEGEHNPWRRKWYETAAIDENVILLSHAVELFIEYKSQARGSEGWSKSVAKREGFVLRKFARMLEMKPLSSLSKNDLQAFYYREGVTSDHTRKGDYISVNTFLNWCIEKGFIESKPKFRPKKPQRKIPKFIYPKELAQLIEYRNYKATYNSSGNNLPVSIAHWIPLCWLVMAGTGLRRKELVHLKKWHIEGNTIIIGEDFPTKVRAERRVPLLFESKWAVGELLKIETGNHFLTGKKPTYASNKLTYSFSGAWKERFPEKAKRTLYNLKDSFAVRFLTSDLENYHSGMKMNDLKEIFGHASLETTQKYIKAVPPGTIIDGSVWDFIEKF
jgi:integrase